MINTVTNIVDNVCVWDGDTQTWTPPENYLLLVQTSTPALVWSLNEGKTDWVLTESLGQAGVGFTWNGTQCVTNELKPEPISVTSGTQDL